VIDPNRAKSIAAEIAARPGAPRALLEMAMLLRTENPALTAAGCAQILRHFQSPPSGAGSPQGHAVSAALVAGHAPGGTDSGPLQLAQALKGAGYTLDEIAAALIAPGVYPDLTALQVGQILLDPSMFPATTQDQMSAALLGAKFPQTAVAAALAALYPSVPVTPFTQAPLLSAMGASRSGGGKGAQLWSVDTLGRIWYAGQLSPGGTWSPWSGPNFNGQTFTATQVAVAGQNTGVLQLWALDAAGMLWTAGQQGPGGGWGPWSGPNFNGQPGALSYIAAAEQSGNRGVELWGVDAGGNIWTIYQTTPGGAWSSWEGPGFKGQPVPAKQVVAAGQNNGNVYVWAMDANGALYGISQQWAGGDWGPWTGANIGGQPGQFTQMAASQQGGNRGVEVWGIDGSGQIWTLYQMTAGGPWSSWEGPGFKGQPVPMTRLAASQQSNGCCELFTLDAKNQIWTITQGSPGGDWGPWQPAGGQRLPPLGVPVVSTVPQTSSWPPGLQQVTTPFQRSTYPVMTWNGYTYWPYSYLDNRMSLALVAYDRSGNPVHTFELGGTRYVGTITIDPAGRNVTFTGQSGAVTVPLSTLVMP